MDQELEYQYLCKDAHLTVKIALTQKHTILKVEKNLPGILAGSDFKAFQYLYITIQKRAYYYNDNNGRSADIHMINLKEQQNLLKHLRKNIQIKIFGLGQDINLIGIWKIKML